MKRFYLAVVLVIGITGCACPPGAKDEDLLRRIRKDLVENVHPTYGQMLDTGKTKNDKPLIEPNKDAQLGVIESMVDSIDRVYPPAESDAKWAGMKAAPAPWRGGDK